MRIFLDVDDTLADFSAACIERGVPRWTGTWYTTPRDTWSAEQKAINDATCVLMDRDDFWPNIPVAPGAFEIMAAAALRGEVYLLTALPGHALTDPLKCKRIERQKLEYAERVLHVPRQRVIVCERAEKKTYAVVHGELSVLVDDAEQNCAEWSRAGGLALHHADYENTVRVLKSWGPFGKQSLK